MMEMKARGGKKPVPMIQFTKEVLLLYYSVITNLVMNYVSKKNKLFS